MPGIKIPRKPVPDYKNRFLDYANQQGILNIPTEFSD